MSNMPDSLTPSGHTKKPTIAELEAILESDAQAELEILPNGEIRRGGARVADKPLTFRDNLGGEYGEVNAAPCVICGTMTVWACSDCAIDGKGRVHICVACQRDHEKEHPEVNHV